MPKAEKSLKQILYDIRRREEHRAYLSEKKIRRIYQNLMKDLQGFLGEYYAKYADDDGGLSVGILRGKMKYARFLEEIVEHVDSFSPEIQQEILKTVADTYEASYSGMLKAAEKVGGGAFSGTGLHAETMMRAIENPISGLTLPDTLEKQRKDVIYELKKAINTGLVNGDRYDTVAKKITERLDMDYRKAVTTVRTETHRVREAGLNDSAAELQSKIEGSGLVYASIWRTMKDEAVRPNVRRKTKKGWKTYVSKNGADHQKLEGQMVVSGEKFDLGGGVTAKAPGNSGDAKNDIRCRCFLEYELMTEEEFLQRGGKFPKKAVDKPGESGIIKTNKQFGKKVGKHAPDWGLDASSSNDREKMEQIIDDIYLNHDAPVKIGKWRGQTDDVLFYTKGEDVVITKQNGEFVTILKGGKSSGRVKDARER